MKPRDLVVGLGLATALVARRARPGYPLRDKVALVTGGSRGLGLVLARELLSAGAKVAICARDEDELGRAHAELVERGPTYAHRCDLTDRVQVAALVEAVQQELGPIDIVINNAGVISVGPVEHMTFADYELAMRTHFWAPLQIIQAVLPGMRARREGRIVNIASIGGKIAMPHLTPYSASKFALVGLSEGLHAELAKDGIVVTTVCPGLMRTGSPPNATFKGQHRAEYAWFSISDSLPLISMSAERAARRILRAIRRGEAEVVLSPLGWIGAKISAVVPSVTQTVLGMVNRLLPGTGGIGPAAALGKDSASAFSPSIATALSDAASERNNEL